MFSINESKNKVVYRDDPENYYKGLHWDSAKEASDYYTYIYKKELDLKYNVKKFTKELLLIEEIEEDMSDELDKINYYNKQLNKFYNNSFLETQEWKERENINYFYMFYTFIQNVYDLQFREQIQRLKFNKHLKYIRGNPQQMKRYRESNLLYTDELEDVEFMSAYRFYKKALSELSNIITDYKQKYEDVLKKYYVNDNLEYNKQNLIQHKKTLDNLINEKEKIIMKSLVSSDKINKCLVEDLKKENLLQNKLNYNIFVYSNDEIYKVAFIGEFNDRFIIIKDNGEIALNDDLVLFAEYFKGNTLDYLQTEKTFKNEDEIDFTKNLKYDPERPKYKREIRYV